MKILSLIIKQHNDVGIVNGVLCGIFSLQYNYIISCPHRQPTIIFLHRKD